MHYAFPFLPLEIQTSITELRALGTPEGALDLLIDRIAKASEAKTTNLQMSIVQIEDRITDRLGRLVEKLVADNTTHHGATNGMLSDVLSMQRDQAAAVDALRAEFRDGLQSFGDRMTDIESWRVHVDSTLAGFRQSRDESKAQRTRTELAVADLAAQFTAFVTEIQSMIAQGPTHEEAQRHRVFIDNLMRTQRESEADGA